MMKIEQEHNGTGDNIGRDKYELNYTYSTSTNDIQSKLKQRIEQTKYQNKDIGNSILFEALKDVVKDIIEQEQNAPHQIVPLWVIKDKFKSLFEEDVFIKIIRDLHREGVISVTNTQVCYLEKQTNYEISL